MMKTPFKLLFVFAAGLSMTACVSKKTFADLQARYDRSQTDLVKCGDNLQDYKDRLTAMSRTKDDIENQKNSTLKDRDKQIADMGLQIIDLRTLRDKQLDAMSNLTVLSKEANANIDKTLSQLEKKDKYINLLQAARTKTDSINLALAVNLKQVLNEGIEDKDVEIKIDKTVVLINISDKMLFNSGSAKLSSKANAVLEKIAQIIKSKPDLEVMIEGYTDNVAINTECVSDNWDLSVKRSTAVVRVLQQNFNIDPNKLIAAGRGEYNAMASNSTPEGKMANRRTRIILMPRLDQFYDLLNPDKR
jgi:chemotaxis protein MotB